MKIIVTHDSPDMDAITSVWLIKKYLPNWDNATVQYVPAGERLSTSRHKESIIEKIKDSEVIHVDTGLGPLDHHETSSDAVCAASRTWDWVKVQNSEFSDISDKITKRIEAIDRIVKVVIDIDHFKEVFWGKDPTEDYLEFSIVNILEGLKVQKPNQNDYYTEFVINCLDALLHEFENRIWAEEEIKKAVEFKISKGKGLGFDTINDSSVKLSQKMGYVIAVRKDPRKGYVRIKVRPDSGIDLTPVYEQLKKMDPDATWFLHASLKMLLNGSVKNPKMRPTKQTLNDIINVLKSL